MNIWVMRMKIKVLTTEYAQDVYLVLSSSFSNPWSADTVKSLLESDTAVCFGAFEEDTLVGYAALEWVLDEGSLTDIAVLPAKRKKGVASLLMEALVDEAQKRNLQFVTLEVRQSNTPAISLYRKFGFEEVGKRPKYYKDPSEDALLMTRNL